jgi:hypothetical protein
MATKAAKSSQGPAPNRVIVIDGKVVILRAGDPDNANEAATKLVFRASTATISDSSDERESLAEQMIELTNLARAAKMLPYLDSVRTSTLFWRLETSTPKTVWKDLVLLHELRDSRVHRGPMFDYARVCGRFQRGLICQQGHDRKSRPIVWLFAGLENRRLEYTNQLNAMEYVSCMILAFDYALQRRPRGVEEITLFIGT